MVLRQSKPCARQGQGLALPRFCPLRNHSPGAPGEGRGWKRRIQLTADTNEPSAISPDHELPAYVPDHKTMWIVVWILLMLGLVLALALIYFHHQAAVKAAAARPAA